MALSYQWEIGTLDTYPTASDSQSPANKRNDVIHMVHWTLMASTGSMMASIIGTQALSTDNLASYTEFNSLDQKTVTGWVTASMELAKTGSVQELKNIVSQSLNDLINPISVPKHLLQTAVTGSA